MAETDEVDLEKQPGTLRVSVANLDDKPLGDAQVHLSGTIVLDRDTDQKTGHALFVDIAAGRYEVVATKGSGLLLNELTRAIDDADAGR